MKKKTKKANIQQTSKKAIEVNLCFTETYTMLKKAYIKKHKL